jgi:exosortase
MVPFPASLTADLEYFLQHSSASLANVGFQLSDLPVFRRSDLEFQLPGITLGVSPECSGIQSTVALFIVSLAAGYVFLRSPWKRALLSLAVIPLGILRNAIRIVTIGELCVHVGPDMINSYIHRKGGWIFFLVTLVPFVALLLFFAQSEHPRSKSKKLNRM